MFEDEDLEWETQAAVDQRRQSFPPPPAQTREASRKHKPDTPQFSEMAVVSVRRLAWALNTKMPAAVDFLVQSMPALFQPAAVCRHCQDKTKCTLCVFHQPSAAAATAPAI
jgi:hypothetical protein